MLRLQPNRDIVPVLITQYPVNIHGEVEVQLHTFLKSDFDVRDLKTFRFEFEVEK